MQTMPLTSILQYLNELAVQLQLQFLKNILAILLVNELEVDRLQGTPHAHEIPTISKLLHMAQYIFLAKTFLFPHHLLLLHQQKRIFGLYGLPSLFSL